MNLGRAGGKVAAGAKPQIAKPSAVVSAKIVPNIAKRQQRTATIQNKAWMQQNQADNERQLALRKAKTAELKKRFARGYKTKSEEAEKKRYDYKVFPSTEWYPGLARKRLYVDPRNECIFVPIAGLMVPFGVRCVKNMTLTSANIAGEWRHYLRVNFYYPGGGGTKMEDYPAYPGSEEWNEEPTAKRQKVADGLPR